MILPFSPGYIKLQYFCNNLKILQQTGLYSFNSTLKNLVVFPRTLGQKKFYHGAGKNKGWWNWV